MKLIDKINSKVEEYERQYGKQRDLEDSGFAWALQSTLSEAITERILESIYNALKGKEGAIRHMIEQLNQELTELASYKGALDFSALKAKTLYQNLLRQYEIDVENNQLTETLQTLLNKFKDHNNSEEQESWAEFAEAEEFEENSMEYVKQDGTQIIWNVRFITAFVALLKEDYPINSLIIRQFAYGEQPFLNRVLENNTKIRHLDLTIDFNNRDYLAKIFKTNDTIEKFTVSCAHNSFFQQLAEVLKENKTLRHLTCATNFLTCKKALGTLSSMLTLNTSLHTLNLARVPIEDEGIELLAKGLQGNMSLRELVLDWQWIQDRGREALLDALKVNATLERLSSNIVYYEPNRRFEPQNDYNADPEFSTEVKKRLAESGQFREKTLEECTNMSQALKDHSPLPPPVISLVYDYTGARFFKTPPTDSIEELENLPSHALS